MSETHVACMAKTWQAYNTNHGSWREQNLGPRMGGKYAKECYKISRRSEIDKYGWRQVPLPVSVHTVMNFRCQKRTGSILYTWVRASWIEFNDFPTRCDLVSLLHFCRQLYMFRVLTPIIRSWYSCKYSFLYWLTAMSKIYCY